MGHVDTSEVIRASVWIRPTGEARDQIVAAGRRVRARGGGPEVEPHLTLLSGIETTRSDAELKLKRLASRLGPFTVRLGTLRSAADYFRCLYVVADTPAELAAAKRAAHDVFEMNPPVPFEPHISLCYGNLDEALKSELAAELGGRLDVSFTAGAVQLVNAAPGVQVTEWRVLAECQLAERERSHT
jgi:2'-5' RNA ligase